MRCEPIIAKDSALRTHSLGCRHLLYERQVPPKHPTALLYCSHDYVRDDEKICTGFNSFIQDSGPRDVPEKINGRGLVPLDLMPTSPHSPSCFRMPLMSGAARLSLTKALGVALVAWLTCAVSIPASVHALAAKETHTSVSDLKANATTITSEASSTVEERTDSKTIATLLAENMKVISEDVSADLTKMHEHSVANPTEKNLLSRLDRDTWRNAFISDSTEQSKKKAFNLLYLIMLRHYKTDGAVVDALHETFGLENDWFFLGNMKKAQLSQWRKPPQQTVESVFELLKIDKIPTGQLLASPRTTQWFSFASPNRAALLRKMYKLLTRNRDLGALIQVLIEWSYANGADVHECVYLLLREQFWKWKSDKETAEYVAKFLSSLDHNKYRSIHSRYGVLALDYIKWGGTDTGKGLNALKALYSNKDVASFVEKPNTKSFVRKRDEGLDEFVELPPRKKYGPESSS